MTFTVESCVPDGGSSAGMGLYTVLVDGTPRTLEAPNGLYQSGQEDTRILTDISAGKHQDGKADLWLGTGLTF